MGMKIDKVTTVSEICVQVMMIMQEEALEKHPQDLPFPSGIIQEYPGGEIAHTVEAEKKFNELFNKFSEIFEDNKID